MDDALSRGILAIVLTVFKQNGLIATLAIVGGTLYALVTLLIIRPLLRPLGTLAERKLRISGPMLAVVLLLIMLCARVTDTIGIYSIFGRFLPGISMPRGFFAKRLQDMLEPLVNFLLPLFFIYSGLNVDLIEARRRDSPHAPGYALYAGACGEVSRLRATVYPG